jgi:hypothetical protein
LAVVVPPRDLARAIDRAERLEVFDLAAVDDVLSRANRRPGARALREAVEAWRPRNTRKELEDRFADLVVTHDLPCPLTNALVHGDSGTAYEVDAYWPEHNLIVELDSWSFHRTRLDHRHDAEKQADLELAGHRITRIDWHQTTAHATRTARRISSLLSFS